MPERSSKANGEKVPSRLLNEYAYAGIVAAGYRQVRETIAI
jgi:hypothetical protein